MSALNRSYFPDDGLETPAGNGAKHIERTVARWHDIARGATPAPGGQEEHNGGIVMPRRVHLKKGMTYFRFASSARHRERSQFGGAWWVEFETLKTITNFARRHSSPRDAVRYLLALPWEWSEVDKLVSGVLEEPLDAYRGKGRRVQPKAPGKAGAHANDRGVPYTPPQHLDVYQLCIPGLYDPEIGGGELPDAIRRQAFPHLRIEDIWTSTYFR